MKESVNGHRCRDSNDLGGHSKEIHLEPSMTVGQARNVTDAVIGKLQEKIVGRLVGHPELASLIETDFYHVRNKSAEIFSKIEKKILEKQNSELKDRVYEIVNILF